MNSGKILSALACACASAQAFAASFLFTGSSDGDLSNYQNYYALSETNSNDVYSKAIYLYSMDYAGDNSQMRANCPESSGGIVGKYEAATSLPGVDDTIYLYSYKFAEVSGDTVTWNDTVNVPYPVSIKNSLTANQLLIRGGSPTIYLGDSAASESEFSLNLTNLKAGYNSTNIEIADGARQTKFSINVSGDIAVRGGNNNYRFGSASAFIDSISANRVIDEGNMILFARQFAVGSGGFRITNSGTLTVNVDDALFACTGDSALISVEGTFEKSANAITFDFSNVSVLEGISGTYNLISAGELAGFDTSDARNDISFDSIYATFGEGASLAWNGNTLQLTIVPEPAAAAALFGALAAAIAAARRRR